MKVTSKLAEVEFRIGSLRRDGNRLVIDNDPGQPMRTRVYVGTGDVVRFITCLLRSPSALLFVLGFPWFWLRARRAPEAATGAGEAPGRRRDPWGEQ